MSCAAMYEPVLQYGHVCNLCGVSFRINRVRDVAEPVAESVFADGAADEYSYCHAGYTLQWAGGCGRSSGCMVAFRYSVVRDQIWDPFSPMGAQRDLILRYMELTEKAILQAGAALPDIDYDNLPPLDQLSAYIRVLIGGGRKEKLLYIGNYSYWKNNGKEMTWILRRRLEQEGLIFYPESMSQTAIPDKAFEHVSGPGCRALCGYAGSRISMDEAIACRIVQAINPRADPQTGQQMTYRPDDEDWERLPDCEWILTGLSRSMTEGHKLIRPVPCRQKIGPEPMNNLPWHRNHGGGTGMLFHPTCLEVFKRVALKRHGKFDVNQLRRWFFATGSFNIHRFPRHPAVQRGTVGGHQWNHCVNDEWVIADPCNGTDLESMLEEIQGGQHQRAVGFDMLNRQMSNFSLGAATDAANDDATTRLACLPTELLTRIFHDLSIEFVANIALADPSLLDVVRAHLRRRVDNEWPWLWESWCRQPYSKWTTMSTGQLYNIYQRVAEEEQDGLRTSILPGCVRTQFTQESLHIHEKVFAKAGFVPRASICLGPEDCSSHVFVRLVAMMHAGLRGDTLKGLRNRQRIWTDCMLVLDQIETLERAIGGDWDVIKKRLEGRWTRSAAREALEDVLYGQSTAALRRLVKSAVPANPPWDHLLRDLL